MEPEIQKTQFADIIRPFRRHMKLLVIPFISVVFTVALLTWTAQPLYESKAAVYIGSNDQMSFDADKVAVQRYLVKNQIPILKSRQLAADVIHRFQESGMRDSLYLLGSRSTDRRIPFLPTVKSMFVRQKSVQNKILPVELIESFRDATTISEQLETNVLVLIAKSPSPEEAAFMVNTWVDAYLNYDRLISRGDASENKQFLESKLNDVKQNLDLSEQRLLNFQQRENVVALTSETEQLVTQLSAFETQFNQARTDLESNQNQLYYLKNQLDDSRRSLVDDILRTSNPVLQQLQQQMAELVTEKAAYEAQLTGAGLEPKNDGRLQQLTSRLEGVRKKIIEETTQYIQTSGKGVDPLTHSESLITQILDMETQQQALEARTRALQKVVDDYNRKLSFLPEKSLRLAQLQRDVQVNRDIYAMLRQRFEEVKIGATGLGGNIVVLDRGQPPLTAVYPRKKMNMVLAVFFGLLLSIVLVFAKDYFEDYIWCAEDVEQFKIKVIGTLPFIEDKSRKYKVKSKKLGHNVERAKSIGPYLINHQKKTSILSESYRVIRTYIHYRMQNDQAKTLLITSPGPGEGKSTTVANIGMASAQKGLKTLLVDCDLRKPVQDVLLNGISRNEGLVTYLCGRKNKWNTYVRETPIRNLDILPAGAPTNHASEIISSRKMQRFIQEVSQCYQLIVFDCPPILPVTDAVILSEYVQGVLLTVKVGHSTKHGTQLALNRLRSIKAPLWGAILTNVPKGVQSEYEAYYESYSETGEKA